jgi:hypothetical protein
MNDQMTHAIGLAAKFLDVRTVPTRHTTTGLFGGSPDQDARWPKYTSADASAMATTRANQCRIPRGLIIVCQGYISGGQPLQPCGPRGAESPYDRYECPNLRRAPAQAQGAITSTSTTEQNIVVWGLSGVLLDTVQTLREGHATRRSPHSRRARSPRRPSGRRDEPNSYPLVGGQSQ